MDVQTALSNLYQASRLALLTADQHDKLRESAEAIHVAINPPEKPKRKAKPATSAATTNTSEVSHVEKS